MPIDRECRACGNIWKGGDLVCPPREKCPECGVNNPRVLHGSSGARPKVAPAPQVARVARDREAAGLCQAGLPEELQRSLADQPESGMGYQEVAVRLADGREVKGIVIGCRVLETVQPVDVGQIREIKVTS